jgi:hypothetical protein
MFNKKLKMWKCLKLVLVVLAFKSIEAQMTQQKFKRHFVVKSTWSLPQWTNNAQRYNTKLLVVRENGSITITLSVQVTVFFSQ